MIRLAHRDSTKDPGWPPCLRCSRLLAAKA